MDDSSINYSSFEPSYTRIWARELGYGFVGLTTLLATAFGISQIHGFQPFKLQWDFKVRMIATVLASAPGFLSAVILWRFVVGRPLAHYLVRKELYPLDGNIPPSSVFDKRARTEQRQVGENTVTVIQGRRGRKHSGEWLFVEMSENAPYKGRGVDHWKDFTDAGYNVVPFNPEEMTLDELGEAFPGKCTVGVASEERRQSIVGHRSLVVYDDDAALESWQQYIESNPELRLGAAETGLHAVLLEGDEGKQHSGEVVLLSLGNDDNFEERPLEEFRVLQEQGYSVALFAFPGYGKSKGKRSPKSDIWALEQVVSALNKRGFGDDRMLVIGECAGCGAALNMAAQHRFGRLVLVAPFADLESVISRILKRHPFGALAHKLCVKSVVRDYFDYRALSAAERCQVEEILVVEAEKDELMRLGGGRPEAEKLIESLGEQRVTHRQVPGIGHYSESLYSVFNLASWIATWRGES